MPAKAINTTRSSVAAVLKDLKPSPMPARIELMLCTLIGGPFDDPAWEFEPKLDGLRVLCRIDSRHNVTLISRNDKEQNFQFPEIVSALAKQVPKPAILDGEIVCLGDGGLSSFRALQQRFHVTSAAEVTRRAKQFPAYLYVFDILYHDRFDLRRLRLGDRKRVLRAAVKWSQKIRWTEIFPRDGTKLFQQMCRAGGEGIVGKRFDSMYPGGRNDAWVKIKCESRQEFVIGGFTDPQRSRIGLGALLVGYYDDAGKLAYAGKVGTGFDTETLRDLRRRLDAIEQKQSPFESGPKPPGGERVHWVKPKYVGEIAFAEWTQNEMLRQPRFEGLRMDKKPKQVVREKPKSNYKRSNYKRRATEAQRHRGSLER